MFKLKINKSVIRLFRNIIISMIIIDVVSIIILIIDYMNMTLNKIGHKIFGLEEYFFILILILQIIIVCYYFLKWSYSYYELEKGKLKYYSGIIFKNKKEFIICQIGSIDFKQSILGKMFNYGDIYLFIQNKKHKLYGLANPEQFIKMIHYYNK